MKGSVHEHASQKKRILYFDLLTIVSCFAVIALHCNGLAHDYAYRPDRWPIALFFEVIFYWAVDVFFMLTGANNMTYRSRYTTRDFLLRRLERLAFPWLAWSIIVYIVRFGFEQGFTSFSVLDFLSRFFGSGVEGVYWFFPTIISLTLIMPVLSKLAGHRKAMWYFVILSFAFTGVISPLTEIAGRSFTAGIGMPMGWYPAMLACLGYLLSTQSISKKCRYCLYFSAIAALVFRYVSTYFLSIDAGETIKLAWGYGSFVAIIPAVAIFIFFKNFSWGSFFTRNARIFAKVSGCAFGIYLVHNLVLNDVVKVFFGVDKASLWLMIVGPFSIFAISLVVVYAAKKLPILRKLVP